MRSERCEVLSTHPTSSPADGDPADGDPPDEPPGSVDARFTLAAERTALAWIRTALGFIAGGVGLIYVTSDTTHPVVKYSLGVAMVILGSVVAVMGGVRWRQTTEALHGRGSMPSPTFVFVLIGCVVVLSSTLIVAMAVSRV